ncbi:MAG: putative bifunctional diguanylate cyclase/phosphodiesterase [Jatrophihabitantaceae bacterium]
MAVVEPVRRGALLRAFGVALWCLLAVCPLTMVVILHIAPAHGPDWITLSMGIFFSLVIARLATAIAMQPERHRPLLLLLTAVVLFAAGSVVLNTAGTPDLTHFPAPGEWLFLASYVAMAAFLILDASKRLSTSGTDWLETAVVCGGTACLAGSVLVTVAAQRLKSDGLPLLVALLYPLIDVILALLVIAQILLRIRGPWRESLGLLGGFVLFACADVTFLLHLSKDAYDYSSLSIVMWGAGLTLITGHACRARTAGSRVQSNRGMTTLVVAAGMSAAFVLAALPNGSVRVYLIGPALATLAASGARLVLAVRQANRAAEAIALSRSDDLTSLPNRRAVLAKLDEYLAGADPFGLMILDLDGFKDINDTLGHGPGDGVLREVAVRMRAALAPDIMVARLGGDEFAVIVATDDEITLHEVAQDVLTAVRTPLVVDGITLSTDASVGITARTTDDRVSSELLRRADVAMYDAKERRAGVVHYDPDGDGFSRERLSLGDELRRAVREHQLVLHYQPQIDAATRKMCGLEALVRWNHPQHGLMSPAQFLPVARRCGLMQAISDEVGRIAVADLIDWRADGITPRVAINCAPPELMADLFVPRLHAMLLDAGIGADSVVIEVTEDSFLAEPERARSVLSGISERGFQISIDDYGTGFSSLSYLRDLPIHELKMDRSFVSTMCSDPRSRMIVASTFQMAAALGLRTVAEGVEDVATVAALFALDVDVLQGYHLSRPLAADLVVPFAQESYALTRPPLRIAGGATA